MLHWSLLPCCHNAEALFPMLPPAVNQIISMCFARYTLINVSCCTKKVETGLQGPQLMAHLDFKITLGMGGNKKSRKEQVSERKRKTFPLLQLGRAMTGSPDEHHSLGVLSRVVVGQPKHFSHSTCLVSIRTCSFAVPDAISTNWATLDQV